MSHDKRVKEVQRQQVRQVMNVRGAQLGKAASILGAVFFGSRQDQEEALKPLEEDVDELLRERRRADAIVVHGEVVDDDKERSP